MTNLAIRSQEFIALTNNLSISELKLYFVLYDSQLLKPSPDYFTDANLAQECNLSLSSLVNAKSGLKQKGYALIKKLKHENNSTYVEIIVGKHQVELFNLGLPFEILDLTHHEKLMVIIRNPKLTTEERIEILKKHEKHYKQKIN
jgi:hypothetical protein